MKIKVTHSLTQEYRNKVLIETGNQISSENTVEIDLVALTPDERKLVVAYMSTPAYNRSQKIDTHSIDYSGEISRRWAEPEFDHPLTVSEVLVELQKVVEQYNALVPESQRIIAENKRAKVEAEAKAKVEAEAKKQIDAEREAKAEAEKSEREAKKSDWIQEHGSSHLQKCLAGGYSCQRLYVEERAAIELPDFRIDFSGKSDWKERSNPSEVALDLETELKAKGFDAQIVWLTNGTEEDYDEPFEPCEAIVVRYYLGKYDTIKKI